MDTSIAVTQHYGKQGSREDLNVLATKKSVARLIYGPSLGGTNTEQIHKASVSLSAWSSTFRGCDVSACHAKTVYARLFTRLVFDEQVNLRRDDAELHDPAAMGRRWKGTVEIALDEWLGSQIRAGYWLAVDWERLRAFNGRAKTLGLLFSRRRRSRRAARRTARRAGLASVRHQPQASPPPEVTR